MRKGNAVANLVCNALQGFIAGLLLGALMLVSEEGFLVVMLSKSKSPDSAGASSAQASSMTAPASNPTSTTDTPSQAPKTSTSSGPTTATTQEKVYSSYLDLELSDVEPCISGPKWITLCVFCCLIGIFHVLLVTDVELLNAINTGSPDATRFLTVMAICNLSFLLKDPYAYEWVNMCCVSRETGRRRVKHVIVLQRNLVASLLSSTKLGINESPRLANIVPGVFRRALREGNFFRHVFYMI
ncbi:hypothetical protein Tco_0931746 [Tanacetum coccineum]